jgi:bifunctional non-homologous end joining protein LigD
LNTKKLLDEYGDYLKKETQPDWINPMLATLTEDYFDDIDWIYERKLDGERCLAFKKEDDVKLYSRNKKLLNNTYPKVVNALKREQGDFIVDGEVVAFEGELTSFSKLQKRMHKREQENIEKTGIDVYFYLFDIMHLNGYNTEEVDLVHRKEVLKSLMEFSDPIRFVKHRREKGIEYHDEACDKGWEGIIAKDSTSKYVHARSKKWLKFKCRNQQEFVIGGYTEPQGERAYFGALLIGYYQGDDFIYAGKVGTGYTEATLETLGEKLRGIETEENPFEGIIKDKGVHWVEPKLVCEVKFTEWTDYDKLRHPSYLGLRRDKSPKEIKREIPA